MLVVDRRTVPELAPTAVALAERFPDLPTPVVLPWTDRPVLWLEVGGPWLYGPAHRDPTAVHGRPVVPRAQTRRLEHFARLGVPFRGAAIAHEVYAGGPVAGVLDLLAAGPLECSDEVARQVVGPVPTRPGLARVAERVRRLRELDPIVFGVASPRPLVHGEPALFFPLAVWRW